MTAVVPAAAIQATPVFLDRDATAEPAAGALAHMRW